MIAGPRCPAGVVHPVGSLRAAWVGVAPAGAVAYRRPDGRVVVARFGKENVNGYPIVFGVTGRTLTARCAPAWYRVQLPIRPNGATGFVRASALELQTVGARIVVDLSQRRLTLYRSGRRARSASRRSRTSSPAGRRAARSRSTAPTSRGRSAGRSRTGASASRMRRSNGCGRWRSQAHR
jgi:hypothetical protein